MHIMSKIVTFLTFTRTYVRMQSTFSTIEFAQIRSIYIHKYIYMFRILTFLYITEIIKVIVSNKAKVKLFTYPLRAGRYWCEVNST